MNKFSIISIIAIIIIAIPILYGIWNIYSVEQLQFGTPNMEFRYFEMSNSEKIEMCNPTPFFVSFTGLKISTFYAEDLKGEIIFDPTTIGPQDSIIIQGNFSSESYEESQYFFLHMDWEYYDEGAIRLDPSQMTVETNLETKIIGLIPYQKNIVQSGFDFMDMMNNESKCKAND